MTTWLDALRYLVVLEGAFAIGLMAAVVASYVTRARLYAAPVVVFALSYATLVAVSAWSEWDRIGTDTLGWYTPVKFVALGANVAALARLFQIRIVSRGQR